MATSTALRVLVIASVLSAAGCLGGSDAPADAAAAPPAPTMDVPAADAESADADETARPPEPVLQEVAFDGETGTFACYDTAAGDGCQGQFSASAMRDLEFRGDPRTLAGTLTWETSSPTALEMQVTIRERVDGEVLYGDVTAPTVSGPSPLAFEFDLFGHGGRELVVDVGSVTREAVGETVVSASVAQAFRFEAVLTTIPDA